MSTSPAPEPPASGPCAPARAVRLMAAGGTHTDLDGQVLELLLSVLESVKDDFFAVAASEELTPPQAFLVRLLDEPRPMRELAELLGYDASNITAIADKLEDRGLLERRSDPTDRRVRHLALTAAGCTMRTRLDRALHERMTVVSRLDEAQKVTLRDLLRVALAD